MIAIGEHNITINPVKKIKVIGYDTTGKVYGPKLTSKQRTEVGNRVAYFVNTKITSGMSDLEKVKTAHDYITAHCSKALCDSMGIGCYHVYANQNALNPSHQWNLVQVDGNWYHIDLDCNNNSHAYTCFLLSNDDEKKLYINGLECQRLSKSQIHL